MRLVTCACTAVAIALVAIGCTAAAPSGASPTAGEVLREGGGDAPFDSGTDGCDPTPPVFICIDEPKEGAHIAGVLKVGGQAASPTRSDLVVTLIDASGNTVVLVGLPQTSGTGAARAWSTSVPLPANAARGPAMLRAAITNAQGGGASVTRRLWIDAPP